MDEFLKCTDKNLKIVLNKEEEESNFVPTCSLYLFKLHTEKGVDIPQKAVYKIVPKADLICGMFLSRDLLDYLF